MASRKFMLLLISIAFTVLISSTAFGVTVDTFSDWGPFGTIDHFEVKDGGVTDWDIAKKSGSTVLESMNIGDFVSGTAYDYSLSFSSGNLTLDVDDPDGGTASKSFSFSGSTTGFTDLYIMAKSNSGSSTVTLDQFSLSALSASGSGSKDGYHIYGETFSGPTLLSGTFTFTSSASNSDTELFIAAENPVPLPAAVWLLGSGLVGLVGLRRKFK